VDEHSEWPTEGRWCSATRAADGLSDKEREAIRAAVLALPPLTDEQIDGLCEVIVTARERWARENG
jgi:hypothetical protein